MYIDPIWKIDTPGESTAYCRYCDVELVEGPVYYTEHNPEGTPGQIDLICPVCLRKY